MKIKAKTFFLAFLTTIVLYGLFSCDEVQHEENDFLTGKEVFYWVDEKKVYLYELKYSFVVQMDTTISYDVALQKLTANPHINYVTYLNKKRYVHLITSQDLSLEKVKQQDGVINTIHQYVSDKKFTYPPISMHGTVILQLKPEVTLSEVLSLIDNKAKVLSENNLGTIEIEVFDWDNLFNFCNKISESGKVVFCGPEFSGGFMSF